MGQPRPCSATEAVARARRLLADPSNAINGYVLGTGSYSLAAPDSKGPWTTNAVGMIGSDCAGFAQCWCYRLPRHRSGFNSGQWASVADDINTTSAIEDADHRQELYRNVAAPEPGDLIAYPTIRLFGRVFVGHVAIVVSTGRAGDWDVNAPAFRLLDVVQVCGPNGRKPAAVATDGHVFDTHSESWPKPQHRARLLRMIP